MKYTYKVTERADFGKIARNTEMTGREMYLLGAIASREIRERLERGKDVDGKQMRPYSESYKKQREKKGKQTAVVDLKDTGRMTNSIMPINNRPNYVELDVTDHRKAAEYTQVDRNWWGISREAERRITDRLREFLERKLR